MLRISFVWAVLLWSAIATGQTRVVVKLDINTSEDNFYVFVEGKGWPANPHDTVSFMPAAMPNLFLLGRMKKRLRGGKISYLKYLWVEADSITIKGKENMYTISPQSRYQAQADSLLEIGDKLIDYPALASSLPGLTYLAESPSSFPAEKLEKILALVPEENQDFWAAQKIRKYLLSLTQVSYDPQSSTLKYFIAKNKEDKEEKVVFSSGKWVLLDMSASWCRFCLRDIDELAAIHKKYGREIIMVTLWKDPSFEDYLQKGKKQKDKIAWTSLRDETGAIFKTLDISIYPTYLVINPEGKIVDTFDKATVVGKYLQRVLGY